jgi:FkbM family methyltransferase
MKALLNRALNAALGVQLMRSSTAAKLRSVAQECAARQQIIAHAAAAEEHARNAPRTLQTIFGYRMYANPGDAGLQIHSLAGKSLEEMGGEIGYIHRHVHEGQTVLDIGANIGLLTLVLARKVGVSGRVFAFEPGPVSFGLLKANVWMNMLAQVHTENVAVADRSGPMDLMVCLSGESDNRISDVFGGEERSGYHRIASQCLTIDSYVQNRPIDFIKMDVQGAEYAALQGMNNTLQRNPTLHMILEYTPAAMPVPATTYLDFLQSFGFTFFDLPEDGVERPASRKWILENIGVGKKRESMNLLLRKTAT